jgi:hypothetical protein
MTRMSNLDPQALDGAGIVRARHQAISDEQPEPEYVDVSTVVLELQDGRTIQVDGGAWYEVTD